MAFEYQYQNVIQVSGIIVDNRTYAEKMTIRLSTGRGRRAGGPRRRGGKDAGQERRQGALHGDEPTFDLRNADLYRHAVIGSFVTVTGHFSKETLMERGRTDTHDVLVADRIEETGSLISRVFGDAVRPMDNVRMDDKNMFIIEGELVSVTSKVGGNGKAYRQVQVRVPLQGEEAARAERRARSKGVPVQHPVYSVKAFGYVSDGLARYRKGDNIAILGTIGTKTFVGSDGERRRITSPIASSTGLIARPEPAKKEGRPTAKTEQQATEAKTPTMPQENAADE